MAVNKIQNHFQATWDLETVHLKPQKESSGDRIARIFVDTVTLGLARLIRCACKALGGTARYAILPAVDFNKKAVQESQRIFDLFWFGPIRPGNKLLRAQFEASKHIVTTPDGAQLKATLFRHSKAAANSPTLIYFQANAELSSQQPHRWLLEKCVEKDAVMNFVVFDYRGVGNSKGDFQSANDLQVDGASIVQWVRNELKTPDNQIHFYGRSLGGAVAAQTKALYAKQLFGRFVSERSFSSIQDMIRAHLHGNIKKSMPWLLRPLCYLASPLAHRIVKSQKCSIDAFGAFQKLKGDKWIVYHPNDPVIPLEASLVQKVRKAEKISHRPLELQMPSELLEIDHHNMPLPEYGRAADEIVSFIFDL